MGDAPVLSRLRIAYSDSLVESWLEIQLYDLAEFSGCKEKQSEAQRQETAKTDNNQLSLPESNRVDVFFSAV